MNIKFQGEEGADAGGVSREWFTLLSKQIFNPSYALFIRSANGATFQPSPQSYINHDHLRYFKFIGRVLGKVTSKLIYIGFTRWFPHGCIFH